MNLAASPKTTAMCQLLPLFGDRLSHSCWPKADELRLIRLSSAYFDRHDCASVCKPFVWGTDVECPNCKAPVPQSAKFCAACGSALSRKCPACGSDSPPSAKFCPEC